MENEDRIDEMVRAGMRAYFGSADHVLHEEERRQIYLTCYQNAILMRDIELLQSVLDRGQPVDIPALGHGATGLLLAAGSDIETVQLLLDRGAVVNVEDSEGVTPLEKAVSSGRIENVRLLLEHGAVPNYRTYRGTPLELADQIGTGAIAELLLTFGADRTSASEEADIGGFPSFTSLMEVHPRFNCPLGRMLEHFSYIDETLTVQSSVRDAISRSPDPNAEVAALLTHYNWRWQLIGAFAMLLGIDGTSTIAALWDAFDSGSRIFPQLAVAAERCDPDFVAKARSRVECGCPVTHNRFAAFDWFHRSTAARPRSLDEAPARATASLVALCREQKYACEPWLTHALSTSIPAEIQETTLQRYGAEALSWRQRIDAVLGPRIPWES